jgi:hypothetical protein
MQQALTQFSRQGNIEINNLRRSTDQFYNTAKELGNTLRNVLSPALGLVGISVSGNLQYRAGTGSARNSRRSASEFSSAYPF